MYKTRNLGVSNIELFFLELNIFITCFPPPPYHKRSSQIICCLCDSPRSFRECGYLVDQLRVIESIPDSKWKVLNSPWKLFNDCFLYLRTILRVDRSVRKYL